MGQGMVSKFHGWSNDETHPEGLRSVGPSHKVCMGEYYIPQRQGQKTYTSTGAPKGIPW